MTCSHEKTRLKCENCKTKMSSLKFGILPCAYQINLDVHFKYICVFNEFHVSQSILNSDLQYG